MGGRTPGLSAPFHKAENKKRGRRGCVRPVGNGGRRRDGRGRGRWVSPRVPPAPSAAHSCRLGSWRVLSPAMSSCRRRAVSAAAPGAGAPLQIPRSYAQLSFPRIPGLTADRVSLLPTPWSTRGGGKAERNPLAVWLPLSQTSASPLLPDPFLPSPTEPNPPQVSFPFLSPGCTL